MTTTTTGGCRNGARNPAPAGTVAPPQNGALGNWRPAAGPGELSHAERRNSRRSAFNPCLSHRRNPPMKSLLAALALTTALTAPGLAIARPVTLTTTSTATGANVVPHPAFYVTDGAGDYAGQVSGRPGASEVRPQHLPMRYRATGGDPAQINGTPCERRCRTHARDHARPSPTRSSTRATRSTSTPLSRTCATARRGGGAPDDRRRGHAGEWPPLRGELRLRHGGGAEGHDPRHSTAGRVFWPSQSSPSCR